MGSHVALGYSWRHTEVETTMRALIRTMALASCAMCCATASSALAMTGEPYTDDMTDGHMSDSICSINDGMGSVGGGSAGTATSDKELIDDAGSGFVGDGGGAFAQGDGSSVG